MKVKELIKKLKKLPQEAEIIITAMDDYFTCSDFEVHSPIEDDKIAQEIILPFYFERYVKEGEDDIIDLTGVYTEEPY